MQICLQQYVACQKTQIEPMNGVKKRTPSKHGLINEIKRSKKCLWQKAKKCAVDLIYKYYIANFGEFKHNTFSFDVVYNEHTSNFD